MSRLETGRHGIHGDDVLLLQDAWSAAPNTVSCLTSDQRVAFVSVIKGLRSLGQSLANKLGDLDTFALEISHSTEDLNSDRRPIPKELRFTVYPHKNGIRQSPYPQIFMIISKQGLEYGFGAIVARNDPTTEKLQRWIKRTAPKAFDILRRQRSLENAKPTPNRELVSDWTFARKSTLKLHRTESPDVNDWLRLLQSPTEQRDRAVTISRVIRGPEIDETDQLKALHDCLPMFAPLLKESTNQTKETAHSEDGNLRKSQSEPSPSTRSKSFATQLTTFIELFEQRRFGQFQIDKKLEASMKQLSEWVLTLPAFASRNSLIVDINIGDGCWVHTPWIGIIDSRVEPSSKSPLYSGMLISEDLSNISLTLYKGIQYSVRKYGGRASVLKMQQESKFIQKTLQPLVDYGFSLDRKNHLLSETGHEKIFENALIAHLDIPIEAFLEDDVWQDHLATLLHGYYSMVSRDGK